LIIVANTSLSGAVAVFTIRMTTSFIARFNQ